MPFAVTVWVDFLKPGRCNVLSATTRTQRVQPIRPSFRAADWAYACTGPSMLSGSTCLGPCFVSAGFTSKFHFQIAKTGG